MKIEDIYTENKKKNDILNFINSRTDEVFIVAEIVKVFYKKEASVKSKSRIYAQTKQYLDSLARFGMIGKIPRGVSRRRAALYGTTKATEQAKEIFEKRYSKPEGKTKSGSGPHTKIKTTGQQNSVQNTGIKKKKDTEEKEKGKGKGKGKITDLTDDDVNVKTLTEEDTNTYYEEQRTKYGLRKITVFDPARLKGASSYVKNVEIRQMQMNGDGAERIFTAVSNNKGKEYRVMMVKDSEGLWGECDCMDFKCNLPPEHACKHLIATAIKKGWHVGTSTEAHFQEEGEGEDKELKQQEEELSEIMDY